MPIEQFDGCTIPQVTTANIRRRWLYFGQLAWEATWWHRCLFQCPTHFRKQMNIGQLTLLCYARINETNRSFECHRLTIEIVADETSPVVFVIAVVAYHIDCSAIQWQMIIGAWDENVLILSI